MTLKDIPAADAVINAAFGSPVGSRIGELRRYLDLQPDGWFAAWRDGELIGTVGAIDYGPFAWVGMMTIRPDLQRQGLGNLLMEHILGWLDGTPTDQGQAGCPMARLDASSAGKGLYLKLGFVDEGPVLSFDLAQPARRFGLPEGIEPLRAVYIPAAADFDAAYFGARREALIRAFWEDDPDRTFVARNPAGQIQGYCVVQDQKIGPWTCADPETAERLLQAALTLPFQHGLRALMPVQNTAGAKLFGRYGFIRGRELTHMRRGGEKLPGDRACIYGQASYGVG